MNSYNQIYATSIYGKTSLFNEVCFIYSDESLIRYFLKVEAALAKVQGNLDVIPKEAALKIQEITNTDFLNTSKFFKKIAITGFPIVALVEELSMASGKHGKYVHWGATTQDIMDTALILQLKDTLEHIEACLLKIIRSLMHLIASHKNSIMVGRSQMQHALPITFGYKVSLWLAPILNHLEEVKELQKNKLPLQFGGAVGTLASFGNEGIKIRQVLALELGLKESEISWHSSREVLVDISHRITAISGTLGKIGKDISLMSQTEIGEVFEQKIEGRGISSTMPQKRNPIAAQALIVSAKNTANYMSLLYNELVQDHERSTGNWQTEWMAIPNLMIHAAGGIGTAYGLVSSLEIYPKKIFENLMKTNGFVMAEAVMMQLAENLGKQKAHDVIHQLIEQAQHQGQTFREALLEHELLKPFSQKTIDQWLSPENYLGSSLEMIDNVLEKGNRILKGTHKK